MAGTLTPLPSSLSHVWKTNQLFTKNIFYGLPCCFQDEKNQILTTNIWLNLVSPSLPRTVLSIVDSQVKCKFYAEEEISWKILKTLYWRILSSFINLIFPDFSLFTLRCKTHVSAFCYLGRNVAKNTFFLFRGTNFQQIMMVVQLSSDIIILFYILLCIGTQPHIANPVSN